jgi:hypothetical protein
MAKYFMELMLVDYESTHFQPSMKAASALYLSLKLLDKQDWVSCEQLLHIHVIHHGQLYGVWLLCVHEIHPLYIVLNLRNFFIFIECNIGTLQHILRTQTQALCETHCTVGDQS